MHFCVSALNMVPETLQKQHIMLHSCCWKNRYVFVQCNNRNQGPEVCYQLESFSMQVPEALAYPLDNSQYLFVGLAALFLYFWQHPRSQCYWVLLAIRLLTLLTTAHPLQELEATCHCTIPGPCLTQSQSICWDVISPSDEHGTSVLSSEAVSKDGPTWQGPEHIFHSSSQDPWKISLVSLV